MKICVSLRTDTLFDSYFFEQICLLVETLPGLFILPFFPFFIITKNYFPFSSLHHCHFCAIVLQVEFVGALRSVQLRRNEIRFILRDDCPLFDSYFFEQICLLVETLPDLFILLFFPFFIITKSYFPFSSLHHCHFCAIVLQVEFVGVLRSVQLRRNEIRSILGDDCPLSSVQIEGPNSS